ncbi:hypothetical protein [uncultured Alsobacter sp.]|uniref:hypothetical protein n=1 Tax=uncultured Alsobacter sp. TaxID=1748258 RepID=UPI0025CF308E|nr:hypothetical protein [uncultured Alsobacter sp.]
MRRLGKLFLIAGALVGSLPAFAQSRPDSLTMTCDQVRATIARQGVAVIGTGANVYDRYVVDARFCSATQVTRPDFLKTRDVSACLVYTCRERTLSWSP